MDNGGQSDDAAKAIYQDLLDRITTSYWDNDFDGLTKMIRVPHKVSSFGPVVPINTRSDLRGLFDNIRGYLLKNAITQYHRACLAAQFNSADEIEGMHETRLLVGAQLFEDPYPVKSVLRRIDDVWWVCESDNALEPDRGFGRVFHQHVARSAAANDTNSGHNAGQNEGNFSND
ncbi:MAG: hypothetical protein WBB25_10765 [Sulfitobacter sp.]